MDLLNVALGRMREGERRMAQRNRVSFSTRYFIWTLRSLTFEALLLHMHRAAKVIGSSAHTSIQRRVCNLPQVGIDMFQHR